MKKTVLKQVRRTRRKRGIRKRVWGTPERPRLSVFRSGRHMYAQVIDDMAGKTIVASSTVQEKLDRPSNIEAAKAVGKTVAERAKGAGIESVTFDRNGFRYHGRVKAVADAAREAGLKF